MTNVILAGQRRGGHTGGMVEIVLVHPNPNNEDFLDCWVCGHIDCHVATDDHDITICEACTDKLDAGAEIVKAAGAGKDDESVLDYSNTEEAMRCDLEKLISKYKPTCKELVYAVERFYADERDANELDAVMNHPLVKAGIMQPWIWVVQAMDALGMKKPEAWANEPKRTLDELAENRKRGMPAPPLCTPLSPRSPNAPPLPRRDK